MSATLLYDSRLGQRVRTGSTFTDRYLVTIADAASVEFTNPLDDDQLPKQDQPHALYGGSIVRSQSVQERLNERNWIVGVTYSPPDFIVPEFGNAWEVSLSGSGQTTRILVERGVDNPRIIGSNRYFKPPQPDVGAPEAGTHFTEIYENGEKKTIALLQSGERRQEGMDVSDPVANMTMKRRFDNEVNFGAALARLYTVSNDVFAGAPIGTIRFDAITVTPVQKDPQAVPGGIANDVVLSFMFNREGWKKNITHTFETDSGDVSTIHVNDAAKSLVQESFTGYPSTSMFALLDSL